MKSNVHQFPNFGYLTYKLTEDEMNFLWKRIEKAKGINEINYRLAGNIGMYSRPA